MCINLTKNHHSHDTQPLSVHVGKRSVANKISVYEQTQAGFTRRMKLTSMCSVPEITTMKGMQSQTL